MKKIKGYIKTKEFAKFGIRSKEIQKLCDDRIIIKIQQGLYRQADMFLQNQSFIDVSAAYPKAVITGLSALFYHNLTTYIPEKVSIAVLRDSNNPKIQYPPIEVYYINPNIFELGITEIKESGYKFRIYNAERAVCDAFKFRNKIGIDMAKEAITEYMRRKDKDINKLYKMAVACRVYKVMQPWMMAII